MHTKLLYKVAKVKILKPVEFVEEDSQLSWSSSSKQRYVASSCKKSHNMPNRALRPQTKIITPIAMARVLLTTRSREDNFDGTRLEFSATFVSAPVNATIPTHLKTVTLALAHKKNRLKRNPLTIPSHEAHCRGATDWLQTEQPDWSWAHLA